MTVLGTHDAGVTSVRVSGAAPRVFSSSLDGTVREWPGGNEFIRFKPVRLYRGSDPVQPHCLSLGINERYLICGMHHGTVELYSLADGTLIHKLPNPIEKSSYQYNFHTVTEHPVNPDLIAGSNGGYVVVWTAEKGEIVWRETGFRLVNTVRFLRGGKYLMAHEWDPWIHLWNFETRQRIRWDTSLMETSANWVTACVAPAGSHLDFVISTEDADESALAGANVDESDPGWTGEADSRVHQACFLPDGRHLLTGGDAGVLQLWDTEGHEPPRDLDLRAEPSLEGKITEDSERRKGLILTAPILDGESYPPWTIHCLDVAPNGSFAAAGLANGLVLRVEIENN